SRIVVYSIQVQTSGPRWPHIGPENRELFPLRTHPDAATPVILEGRVVFVLAPLAHAVPNPVCRMTGHAVCSIPLGDAFPKFRAFVGAILSAPSKLASCPLNPRPAIAQSFPDNMRSVRPDSLYNCQAPKT